jgi:hypothetical protein
MMSYIYQQSAQVLIWLGIPEDETDAAMAIGKIKDIDNRRRDAQQAGLRSKA